MVNFAKIRHSLLPFGWLLVAVVANANELSNQAQRVLTLQNTVKVAEANDPWLVGNKHSQDAIESMSIAAGTLPDPKVSIGVTNIAADTFDFSQETMSQFKVGISQVIPRGDSLSIKQQQLRLLGSQFPFQREDRKAKLTVTVAKLWLDAYKAQESISLIEKDRALFEQLADLAQASYSSTMGKTRQQDIVRAQLELTRLDDRLTLLNLSLEMSKARLSEWLSNYLGGNFSNSEANSTFNFSIYVLSRELPNIALLNRALSTAAKEANSQKLYQYFSKHPAINALEQKIKASKRGIELARQNYKPEWGVSAGYGFRSDSPAGNDRSDLFSIGITFDIPLFTSNRQDQQVQSAISQSAVVKTEKWILIRRFITSFEANRSQLVRLNDRQKLYQERLLPQMHDQSEASLTAYTNDDGDFSEVIRSRIAELNAAIDALDIDVERQKTIIQLNYFFMKNIDEIISNNLQVNRKIGAGQ